MNMCVIPVMTGVCVALCDGSIIARVCVCVCVCASASSVSVKYITDTQHSARSNMMAYSCYNKIHGKRSAHPDTTRYSHTYIYTHLHCVTTSCDDEASAPYLLFFLAPFALPLE